MKYVLKTVAALLLAVTVCQAADQPNVVIVMTDDQGYPNLSCMGHPLLETPNIDTLYERGVRLTDYHVDPTCAPSRSALMTGRYSDRVGVWHTVMGRNLLREREVTMADIFSASGYATGIFGKWHLGDVYPYRPEDRGFQQTVVHGGGGVGQTPDFWGNDYFDDSYRVNGEMTPFTGFCTEVFFTEAMKFMKASVEQGKPFLTYITPNAPHGPFYAPNGNKERVKNRAKKRGIKLEGPMTGYYGMIENIDDQFGRLQDFLEKEGLAENTILVFTSDNGPVVQQAMNLFNAGLRGGKNTNTDGGHRVPWFMQWPAGGLDKAQDINHVTAHIDILPTLIDLCGLKAPDIDFDGRSLVPLLKNADAAWPDRQLVVESQRVVDPIKYRSFSVMTDRWRLVGNEHVSTFKLYDMKHDLGQRKDVSGAYPEVFERLRESYDALWNDLSQEHDLVSRMIVGSAHQNPVCLTAHDWLGNTLWNQPHILKPAKASKYGPPKGHWAVDVAQDGWYQISLRRWPAEADQGINAAYVGSGYRLDTARIEVQGQKLEQNIPIDAKEVTFRVKLKKGEAKLDTLFTGGGKQISAFYAYILREEGRVSRDWKTREGLGLPLANWPKKHGADPSVR
ncbi:arylsulfatase [Pontiella agarivorans]|uniref:Arylsulfatase n=1 Tax=Pontiella agarivorans TaxID=3038953 RepID=A0ABU5MYM4_9BACT|nr:arylsulfatase [Pontiella agarivorans]MDZ8119081.1 arylsulfatase [Pontiella agarivorans]